MFQSKHHEHKHDCKLVVRNMGIQARKHQIDPKRIEQCVSYCPDSGRLAWTTGQFAGKTISGTNTKGYIQLQIDGITLLGHRVCYCLMTGSMPPMDIDHIDGDKTNNTWSNLRLVNNSDNHKNMKIFKTNSSGVAGVAWNPIKNRWDSYITSRNRRFYLGRFKNFFDAVCARKAAEIKHGFHRNHGRSI